MKALRVSPSWPLGLPLLGLLLLTGFGCGDDPSSTPTGVSPGVGFACEVDPERVDAREACLSDDDCPCGTHCALGICEASCTETRDCAEGQRCDSFGRCRSASQVALLPSPTVQASGARVGVLTSTVQVAPDTGEGVLVVTVAEGETQTVRIVAREGAEVRCPDDSWARECLLEEIAGGDLRLPVRVTDEPAGDESAVATVSVFTEEGEHEGVTVARPPMPAPITPFASAPLSGRYHGTASLVTAGLGDAVDPSPSSPLLLPITFDLHGELDSAVFAIDNRFGALGAVERLIGEVTLTETDPGHYEGSARIPTVPYLQGALTEAQPYEVLAETAEAIVRVQDVPRRVEIELAQRMVGLGPSNTPTVRWVLRAGRIAAAPETPPELPADAVLTYDAAELAAARIDWEERALWDLFGSGGGGSRYLWEDDLAYSRIEPRWPLCFGRVAARQALGLESISGWLDPANVSSGYPFVIASEPPVPAAIRAALAASASPPDYVELFNIPFTPIPVEAGTVPCAGSVMAQLSNAPTTDRPFDICDHLRERTGCTIETLPADADIGIGMNYRYRNIGGSYIIGSATITPRWNRVCRMAETLPTCSTAAVCLQADRNAPALPTLRRLTAPLGPISRAPACDGSRTAAIGLDQLTDGGGATMRDAIEACLADIAKLRAGPAPRITGIGGLNYDEQLLGLASDPEPNAALDIGSCVDPMRLLFAVRFGLAAGMDQPDATATLQEGVAFGLRRLGRWLEIHASFAAEALAEAPRAAVFGGTDMEPIDSGVRLEQSLGGYDLLFHPRFAEPLGRIPGVLLTEADYRVPVLGVAPRPGDPQENGLPVAIFDTAANQMGLVESILAEAHLDGDREAVETLGEALRPTLVAGAMAWALHARAVDVAGDTLPWEERFIAAEARAMAATNGAIDRARRLDDGMNPLGIEEVDLPLYFVAEGSAATGAGAGARYAAVSDFLLGTGPGSDAWAPALVTQASDVLEGARAALVAQGDRDFRADVAAEQHARYVESVRERYDQKLFDYCGPLGGSPVSDPFFSAASCAIDQSTTACAGDLRVWQDRFTEADLLGRVCVARKLRLDGGSAFASRTTRDWFDACVPVDAPDTTESWDVVRVFAAGRAFHELICVSGGPPRALQLEAGALALDPAAMDVGIPGEAGTTPLQSAIESCREQYPTMRFHVPRPGAAIENPDCVSGALGELYLDIVSSSRAVQLARASSAELQESYDIAIESCAVLAGSAEQATALRNAHRENKRGLTQAQYVADTVATTAAGAKECAATASGVDYSTPWGGAVGGGFAVAACVAGMVEMSANLTSLKFGLQIERAQELHEDQLATLEEGTEVRRCYIDARSELVGMHRAAIEFEQAAFELQHAHASLSGLIAETQRTWTAGHAYLLDLEQAGAAPPSGDLSIDEAVETFLARQRLARRVVYLALRAVEYEQQSSLPERADVYDAATPAELQAVLESLWTRAGTRTVNGGRPSDLAFVLSLRDDILRVEDEAGLPSSEHPLTAAERLRVALADQSHAVYDDEGQWLGQRIPFNLIPMGAFGFDVDGVPIYAQTDCAERIWSVNASVLGDGIMSGREVSFVRMDLMKRNTFFSQWCGDAPEGQPFQVASTRPTRNLFREPGSGETVGSGLGTEYPVTSDVRARMRAFIGVDRRSLEDPSYANGETTELAARGLFGEYALFIPAAMIARESDSGEYGNGLVLDRVDDILLRFDYLSVAR